MLNEDIVQTYETLPPSTKQQKSPGLIQDAPWDNKFISEIIHRKGICKLQQKTTTEQQTTTQAKLQRRLKQKQKTTKNNTLQKHTIKLQKNKH